MHASFVVLCVCMSSLCVLLDIFLLCNYTYWWKWEMLCFVQNNNMALNIARKVMIISIPASKLVLFLFQSSAICITCAICIILQWWNCTFAFNCLLWPPPSACDHVVGMGICIICLHCEYVVHPERFPMICASRLIYICCWHHMYLWH